MLNLCTLFDSNYLIRGLTLYNSLARHCAEFHLYIFAFDEKCYDLLKNLRLKYATVISLKEFEDEKLLSVKSIRTKAEYCWTCTPSTILYCLKKYQLESCAYLDADLLFFNSPQVLINELKDDSIILTLHRFPKNHDTSEINGKYCVQFMAFKNNSQGLITLNWWREECIKWCYNRLEDGKRGDQKYLDDWTERYQGVHVLKNLGGGVAPWNVVNYDFWKKNGEILGREISTGQKFKLIFFHYHNSTIYKILGRLKTKYFQPVNKPTELIFYREYDKYLNQAYKKIKSLDKKFNSGINKKITNYIILAVNDAIPLFVKNIYRYIKYGNKQLKNNNG